MKSYSFKATLFAILFYSAQSIQVFAQPDVSQVSVPIELLRKHVFLLASDSLQGRATGSKEQLQAAIYCTQVFRQSHLLAPFRLDSVRGAFRQTFAFTITEVAQFGGSNAYRTVYKRHELVSRPLTTKDSNGIFFGDNIAGLLIGTDLKQEIIVLSAHYDHLGRSDGRIFHGADDNASGTAAVLSIAATFDSLARQRIRSRRSILFVLFSGEEGGLLGSSYFVANSPIPTKQMMCNLNVDMVGRVDEDHRKKRNYCYLISGNQSTTLRQSAETANNQSLNQSGYDTVNDPKQLFYRSDHYNFVKEGIPALFFTNGEHIDYHRPSDTADKIEYDILQKRATLVFQTAWLLANTVDNPPQTDH